MRAERQYATPSKDVADAGTLSRLVSWRSLARMGPSGLEKRVPEISTTRLKGAASIHTDINDMWVAAHFNCRQYFFHLGLDRSFSVILYKMGFSPLERDDPMVMSLAAPLGPLGWTVVDIVLHWDFGMVDQ
jgi:hypothetical protein